jgi:hypothetical protein
MTVAEIYQFSFIFSKMPNFVFILFVLSFIYLFLGAVLVLRLRASCLRVDTVPLGPWLSPCLLLVGFQIGSGAFALDWPWSMIL